MKFFEDKKKIKIIALILVFAMVFISIIPNYSKADNSEDEEVGGKLFNPIFKLFAAVGDLAIKGLQEIFIGEGDIRVENPRKISE